MNLGSRLFLTLTLMTLLLLGAAPGRGEELALAPEAPAAVALAGPPATPDAPAPPSPAPMILRSYKIIGAKSVPQKKLKDDLTSIQPSWLPWKKPPSFRREDLEADIERLQIVYRNYGFYHAVIVPQVEVKDGQAEVRLTITEGPWVKVTQVAVTLARPVPSLDPAQFQAKHPLKPGERFTIDNYEALKRLYLNFLLDHGYPHAKVEGRVCLDEDRNTAEVELKVIPGPLCYFGEVTIKGQPETPDYVIRRKLTFKPGDLFSFKELHDSQRQLYALDLFQRVTLTPAEVSPTERRIPITVDLEERKKRSVKVGLGYGDEEQFRGRLALRFRNLGGGARTLDLDSKYSRLESRVEGTLANPQLWATRNDLILQTGLVRRYLPAYTDKAFFTQARLERDFPWHIRGFVGHGLEFARPFNIPDQTLVLLAETEPGKLYRSSMFILGLRRQTTDDPADPHRGSIFTANGEVAPDWLGSNMQFGRAVMDLRRFQALWETNFIVAGRLKFGLIQPMQATDQIPIFRRFFAGGYNSVRGYRLDYLGPRNPSGDPIGGNAVLEGSLEARIPIYKEFRGVAFLDFGNVYLTLREVDVGQLKYSSGVGLRYQTPIGPLGVDVGFPLNPIDPQRDRYRFHFTIGQAF